jgi:hypothetical protein
MRDGGRDWLKKKKKKRPTHIIPNEPQRHGDHPPDGRQPRQPPPGGDAFHHQVRGDYIVHRGISHKRRKEEGWRRVFQLAKRKAKR